MKLYKYRWHEKLNIRRHHILGGGLKKFAGSALLEMAREMRISISKLQISERGLSFVANKDPNMLMKSLEYHMQVYRCELQVPYDLLLLESTTSDFDVPSKGFG